MVKNILKVLRIYLMVVLGFSFTAHAFQTSSESVNPFNQFASPTGGVNMYGGDVAYSHAICGLAGRNGMDANVALNYSSNVYLNVRARNDIAPAGWCGLGWNLNYGSIRCDHKGTKTHADDEFFWLSSMGFGSKILKKDGKYYIKDDPFTKVEPQDVNSDGVFDGWILTTTGGKKMKYGNLNLSGDRKATKWTFSWGNYVGTGMSGTPVPYPYAWDLAEISDPYGNAVQFYYQQESEYLKVGAWTTPVQYTKASYPLKIVNPEGKRIEFTLESKGNEAYDPYTYQAEPDGFIEMYESMRLSQLKVYVIPGSANAVSTYKLTYTTINSTALGNDYKKSLLTGVETYDGAGTALLCKTQFTYNTNFAKGDGDDATNYDPNYNYGAMSFAMSPEGGITSFQFTRKSLGIAKTEEQETVENHTGMTCGMTFDGFPFVATRLGTNKDLLLIYNWDGSKWFQSFPKTDLTTSTDQISFSAGHNFLAIGSGVNNDQLRVKNWDGASWIETFPMTDLTSGTDNIDYYAGAEYIAVRSGINDDQFRIYNWNGTAWVLTFPMADLTGGTDLIDVYPGGNFIAIRSGVNADQMRVYTWDGANWTETFPMADLTGGTDRIDIYPGNNYVAVRSGGNADQMRVYTWNGSAWTITFPMADLTGGTDNIELYPSGDYIAVRSGSNADQMRIYNWNGSSWALSFPMADLTSETDNVDIFTGGNQLAIRSGNNDDQLRIMTLENGAWSTTFPMVDITDATDGIHVYNGSDFVAIRRGINKDLLNIYVWNGKAWGLFIDRKPVGGTTDIDVQMGGTFFAVRGNDGNKIGLWHKFQDDFEAPVYSYVVSRKSVDPSVGGKPIVTTFSFDGSTGNYDTRAGTAKFNKVETVTPANGKTVQYYFNDTHADNQQTVNANYDKMDGMVYRAAVYNQANAATETNPISTSSTEYAIYTNTTWPPDVYQKQVNKTTGTMLGVTTASEILAYNHINGLPYINRTKNGDGKQKLSKTFFAFENAAYSTAIGATGANMLTSPCQAVVYEKAPGDNSIEPLPSEIRSAQAATWLNSLGCTAWMPSKTYAWKANFNTDGTPDSTFVGFDHTSGAANPNWQYTGGVTKYSANSLPKETAKPTSTGNRTYSSTIYGYNGTLPIATVANSQWEECGVYTAAYRANSGHTNYWDYENGWEKGVTGGGRTAELSGNYCHFGDSVIYVVNNYAACRNSRIYRGKAYTMSAWVRVISGKLYMAAHYLSRTSGTDWPPTGLSTEYFEIDSVSLSAAQCAGKWKLLQLTIPASKTAGMTGAGKEYYARAFIGNFGDFGDTVGVVAYIDDIRFAPSKALVSSTYYDRLWQQPVISIDANNHPGKRVTFDSFGRPVRWDKRDPSKSAGDAGYIRTMQSKKYHLRNELSAGEHIQLNSPTGNDDYTSVASVPIYWVNDSLRSINLYYKLKTGSTWGSWTLINATSLPNQSGWCAYDWTVPDNTANLCRVKVEIVVGATVIERDSTVGEFYVSSPFVLPSGWEPTAVRAPGDPPNECQFTCPCVNGAVLYKVIIEMPVGSPPNEHNISCGGLPTIVDINTASSGNYSIFIYDKAGNRLESPTWSYPASPSP